MRPKSANNRADLNSSFSLYPECHLDRFSLSWSLSWYPCFDLFFVLLVFFSVLKHKTRIQVWSIRDQKWGFISLSNVLSVSFRSLWLKRKFLLRFCAACMCILFCDISPVGIWKLQCSEWAASNSHYFWMVEANPVWIKSHLTSPKPQRTANRPHQSRLEIF